ncbi:hypothetical protein DFR58_103248 [Anaerobacterium chartisolvens]|uniref:Serine aminopeptidase S33 domain-containing protein n=1 Tax=Anaerobacterium chartisolvens TaxID=1297424 RepID=A0A369BDM5_9FIRM|nr:alpha/beta fold hydrolase [Anaerobacterium chartisolvens]RCX19501.1 hypothetical protein DFR58_103248 [Anaerobacterium chartisolvens]
MECFDINKKRSSYILLKAITVLFLVLFFLCFIMMITTFTVEYVSDTNTLRAFLKGLIYIPILIASISVYIILRRKIKQYFTGIRTGKQFVLRIIVKVIIIGTGIFLTILILLPYFALPMFLNRHVNYLGYVTNDFPLQDIYQAKDFNLKENQMYFRTEDGLKIWASEITTTHPKAVIIYLSGIVQPSVTYFYGHAKFMQDNGYASILLDVRGHGKSDGNRICLGYDEVKDVKAVVDYINSQEKYKDVPIVVQGASMGGAIAVNSFGQLKDIDALIAMSAYSSFEDVILDTLDGYGTPNFILSLEEPFIVSCLKLVYGSEKVKYIKPVEQIKNADGRSVLLIASTGDTEVPPINMDRLKEAYPEAQSWLRNSRVHYIIKDCDFKNVEDDEEYWTKILDFLEKEVH